MKTELVYLGPVTSMLLSLFLMSHYRLTPLVSLSATWQFCVSYRAPFILFPTLPIQHPVYSSTSHNQRKEPGPPYENSPWASPSLLFLSCSIPLYPIKSSSQEENIEKWPLYSASHRLRMGLTAVRVSSCWAPGNVMPMSCQLKRLVHLDTSRSIGSSTIHQQNLYLA